MSKGLSTKEYVNLRIQHANSIEQPTSEQNKDRIYTEEVKAINDSILEMRTTKENNRTKFQKFSSDVKDSLLSECIFRLYDKACGIMERSEMNERIKRNLVNSFIQENGANNLLSQFKTKTLILSEFNRLVNKYHKIIIESVDKDNPATFTIEPIVKDKFFDELDATDIDSTVSAIRVRVGDAVEEFIQSNIVSRTEIEDVLSNAKEKIANATKLDVEDNLKEAYNIAAKRKISDIKNNKTHNVFSEFVTSMAKSVYKNDALKNEYMVNNKLDLDKIVERCQIMYTFLETVNTANIVNVDENYIYNVVQGMKQ